MSAIARQASDMTEQTAKRLKEGKKLGGRPSKYCPAILRNSKHYLANYREIGNKIPSIAGLSVYLKTTRERLHTWANDADKPEFHDILNRMKSEQEAALLDNGLDGTFNASVTKLVLSKHGYTENTANSGTSVNVTINRGSVQVETQGQVIDVETD